MNDSHSGNAPNIRTRTPVFTFFDLYEQAKHQTAIAKRSPPLILREHPTHRCNLMLMKTNDSMQLEPCRHHFLLMSRVLQSAIRNVRPTFAERFPVLLQNQNCGALYELVDLGMVWLKRANYNLIFLF